MVQSIHTTAPVSRAAGLPPHRGQWARWCRRANGKLTPVAATSVLVLVAVLALVWAAAQGAYAIAPQQLLQMLGHWLRGESGQSPEELVFLHIRLPRLLLGAVAGAGLGLAGALMQGLFRNPLADPGLIGVSSGAALAAAFTIVMGAVWLPGIQLGLGSWALALSAFGGGVLVTALIYLLAQTAGGTRIGMMLLAGIAINALAGAGLGYLSYVSTDEQLRNLQMWLMGSLGQARWASVFLVGMVLLVCAMLARWLARPLNSLALGEAQAQLLGVPVERTKRWVVLVSALAVGAVTSATGMIGFIGLVAPHGVRLLAGPDHRVVLPCSALLGAALVMGADALARTVVQPAEMPLGVLTAFIGVPLFLWMLRKFRGGL